MSDALDDPYPFESDDDIEIGELDLESVDAFDDERITVGELVGETESWRFGHVIVDEAQDLTPMQWRMVIRRARGRAMTIVGDLAQRSSGSANDWHQVLPGELADIERLDLTVNYRSPAEIHDLATALLAEVAPGVAPSRAIRSSGHAPEFIATDDLEAELERVVVRLVEQTSGQIAVIGESPGTDDPEDHRVRRLTPAEAKGLEFDTVVLIEPAAIMDRTGGAALLYIGLTRATQRLVIVHQRPLPAPIAG